MVVTNKMKKYPSMVKLVSQVVGISKSDDEVTAKSEGCLIKAAALIVVPMAAPI